MPSAKDRFWAICMAKGWVEIRRWHRRPRLVNSTKVHPTTYERSRWVESENGGWGDYVSQQQTHNVTIRAVAVRGGTTVGTLKMRRFTTLTRVTLQLGAMIELDGPMQTALENDIRKITDSTPQAGVITEEGAV